LPYARGCGRPSSEWKPTGEPLHTTYVSSSAEVHYPFHPFYGEHVQIFRRRSPDTVVLVLPDESHLVIPDWMLDPIACAEVRRASEPVISILALHSLRKLLDAHLLPPEPSEGTPGVSRNTGGSDAQEKLLPVSSTESHSNQREQSPATATGKDSKPVPEARGPDARSRDPKRKKGRRR